jgi:hypothetical protein
MKKGIFLMETGACKEAQLVYKEEKSCINYCDRIFFISGGFMLFSAEYNHPPFSQGWQAECIPVKAPNHEILCY